MFLLVITYCHLFISGKIYFTAVGAKRIAHKQKMKGVKFEYVDPEEMAKKILARRGASKSNEKPAPEKVEKVEAPVVTTPVVKVIA